MLTQKDIHNIFAKMDMNFKTKIAKSCDFDIEKIKEFESKIADSCNIAWEQGQKVIEYMNTEI